VSRLIAANSSRQNTENHRQTELRRRNDAAEAHEPKRVMRGGSFLCIGQYCSRYMVGTLGEGEASTGTNTLGLRCEKELPG
jgi:hypothetical protein